ncbi:MAG TPA: ABC transporter permease [Pyrinomonadaceae bacterium]|nr:ABC transporter permease [Pyrinomonadaceae bacterium]
MKTLWQDVRYGARVLRKNPGITLVAVVSLALGIGANTALFSVVDAMLLKKLQVREPERLVLMRWVAGEKFEPGSYNGSGSRDESGRMVRTSFPYQTFERVREQRGALSDVFAFGGVSLNVNADGLTDVAAGQAVTGNYYQVLGVPALHGRTLSEEDDKPSAAPAAVISHRYWQLRFGGDPGVVGRQIRLNNVAFTVVGVTPEGFDGTSQVGTSQGVTIPLAHEPQVMGERSGSAGAGVWWLRLMGRLKEGATLEQAQASLEAPFRRSVEEHRELRRAKAPPNRPVPALDPNDFPQLSAASGAQGEMNTRENYERPLHLLLGVVGLVLLIACANVANLLLARAASRQKEIAVRLALGANRRRLIRQLLTESVLLSLAGGAAGVLLAVWIKDGLLAVSEWGRAMTSLEPSLNLRVLGFTAAVSLVTGVLFGFAPAWRATKVDLTPALKDGAKGSGAASRSWLTKGLVVAQVAMSLLLLVGAGLMLRTVVNLKRVEPGFNTTNLLTFRVEPGLIGYKDERLADLYRQVSGRVESVPGVRSVTFSRVPLLAQNISDRTFYLPGAPAGADGRPASAGEVYIHQVRENFFEAMEIPLLVGRSLSARDDERAPRVAVVNETFARRHFGGENPVGRRLSFNPDKPGEVEIIGLVKDAKYSSQRDEIPPTAYLSWAQELRSLSSATFEVRTAADPAAAVPAIREAVREVEADMPLAAVRTQVEVADQTLAMERLFAKLLSFFGLLAQALAAVGLYGVLAWSVAQRTQEIGIRMALGAQAGDVMRMIFRQGLALALAGVALGLGTAYALTKYLESLTRMLYGVKAADPLTFGLTAAFLTLVAAVACYVPARRATKVDPMVALRYE